MPHREMWLFQTSVTFTVITSDASVVYVKYIVQINKNIENNNIVNQKVET